MSNEDRKWYRASLRLMGDSLPIDEIEAKIEVKSRSSIKKGELFKTEQLSTNVWCAEYLTKNDVPLETQIELWLEKLESKKEVLKEILSVPNAEGELFLGFSSENGQGGAYFTPELLRRVADLGLALSLDLYPPSDFEESANVV